MPNIIEKLDFTTQTAADPYVTVPAGWEYSVGSQQGRTYNISAVSWAAKSVQSNIISQPVKGSFVSGQTAYLQIINNGVVVDTKTIVVP